MFVNLEKIYQIAVPCTPEQVKTVYVKQCRDQKQSNDPDTVFDHINPDHAIHGTGFRVEIEIALYAIIKATSTLYDRDPKDTFSRWPAITLEDFMIATSNWERRSLLIGNDLDYWLKILQDNGFLRVSVHDGIVFLALTPKGVNLILRTVGFKVDSNSISYSY